MRISVNDGPTLIHFYFKRFSFGFFPSRWRGMLPFIERNPHFVVNVWPLFRFALYAY